MHSKYPHIFSPIRIGPVEVPNRFYVAPHAVPLSTSQGAPTDDFVHYYVERIRGGCGLAILSMTAPERGKSVQPTPHPKETVPAMRVLADAVHEAGGKLFGELWYWWGRSGQWSPLSPPAPSMAPSVVQYNHFERGVATREMIRAELRAMLESFRQSAENLREAGFDGVMLHAAHGAMFEHFFSPYFNRRTDEYGGSLENRMRFPSEVLKAVRDAAGPGMAVGMRLNCDEMLEGGYDTTEAYRIVQQLTGAGLVDFVDLDVAMEPNQYHIGMPPVFVEPHVYAPYVKAVRGAAGEVPVLSVLGRLTSVADGEAAIASGLCDMVGAARALIAEPELVKNAREGREDRSRTCIACNWCMASLPEGSQTCTINPASWRERLWGVETFTPASRRSKVVVVGAGPGGLEAARVSALRGHDVTLLEARDRAGGALTLWAGLPGREFYQKSIEWWASELERLGVRVVLGIEATASAILAEQPDAVVLATGARYSEAGHSSFRDCPIPGHDQDFVHRPEAILLGEVRPTGRIVLLDGEGTHAGVGLAEMLAGQGADVEFLTPYFAPVSTRVAAACEVTPIMKRLRSAGIRISATTYVRRIGDHAVTAYDVYSEEERIIGNVDAVILATGRVSLNRLEKELDGKIPQLFVIGDAAAARMWATASFEGHKFARCIGEPGAPRSIGDVYFSPNGPELYSIPADMHRADTGRVTETAR